MEPSERWSEDERAAPVGPQPAHPRRVAVPLVRPRLIWLILAANMVIFGVTWYAARGNEFGEILYIYGAKYGPDIDAGEWWRLLAPIFLHGGWVHLFFNSYALYVLGPASEEIFGSLRFGAVYLLAGLAGSVASYAFYPCALSVGASGSIFGLMGALGAFYWQARHLFGDVARFQVRQMVALAGLNLAIGFAIPNIDNLAHMGGLVGGLAGGLALAPRFGLLATADGPLMRREPRPAGWLAALLVLVGLVGATLAVRALHLSSGLSC